MRNTSGHQGESERQWENKVNKNKYDISSIKRVTIACVADALNLLYAKGLEVRGPAATQASVTRKFRD